MAHSLGNVVVASALSLGMSVDRYALLNAAISAECYDSNPTLRQLPAVQLFPYTYGGFTVPVTYNAWDKPDLSDDPVPAFAAMGYRNRVPAVGGAVLSNFYLENDWVVKGAWEANQWNAWHAGKPVFGYSYDVGIDLSFGLIPAFRRSLTDPSEAMSMVNQSITKAVGGEPRTAGRIDERRDLDAPDIKFFDDHSAEFSWRCMKTWSFYGVLMESLRYENMTK